MLGFLLLSFVVLSCSLPSCAYFFVFEGADFVVQPYSISLSQSKGWFSFILLWRREKCHWMSSLGLYYKLHLHATIWREMCSIFNFCGKHFSPIRKLTWLDKNIFHRKLETYLKNDFIMYYFLRGPWIESIVSSFCPLALSTCRNGELLIPPTHRSLCFKKIRTTTTAFLIFNTAVLNLYSHSITFDP